MFTLSVRSFQVPPTPFTCACPPSLPSVTTSRATRVTSEAKELSWSTMVLMADPDALFAADRAVDRIVVGEVIRIGDAEPAKAGAHEPGQFSAQLIDERIGLGEVD